MGNSTALSAGGGSTYSWTPNTNLSATTGSSVTANPSLTMIYTVTGTDANGCKNTAQATVTIDKPSITATVTSPTICLGNATYLNGGGGLTYTWTPNTNLSSVTGSVVTANPSSTITYTVTGTDVNGCTNTAQATITLDIPAITTVASTTICAGGNTILNAGGGTSYKWLPSTGLSVTNIANPVASPTSTTIYTVTGTDAKGCSNTAQTTITVDVPTVNITSSNPTICSGGTTTLTATSGASSYSWTPNTNLSSTTNPIITANPGSTTVYTVTLVDKNGCTGKAQTTVTLDIPTITASATNPTICLGNSTALSAGGGSTYSWTPNTNLSATTGSSVTANPSLTMIYTVTGTDANGCKNTAQATVTIDKPSITATVTSPTICLGNATYLNGGGGLTYTWTPNTNLSSVTGSVVTANPSSTITYTVTGTDVNGCTNTAQATITLDIPAITSVASTTICAGGSTTLNAGGGVSYKWLPTTGLSNSNIVNPVANPTSTTIYTVTGTDAKGCTNTAQTTITVDVPTVNITSSNPTICSGGSTTLSATSGAASYSWTPNTNLSSTSNPIITANPGRTTIYTVTLVDKNGCIGTAQTTVTVDIPTITVSPINPTMCSGGSTSLRANGASSYTWTPNTNLSATTGSNVIATPISTITYTVTGTDANGCTGKAQATVIVNQIPSIRAGSNVSICEGNSTTLNATGGLSYVWTPTVGLNNSNISNPTTSTQTSGTYTVIGTDANGCTGTAQVNITVNPNPTANAGVNQTICETNNTQIGGRLSASGGTAPYNYLWQPSAGLSDSTNSNPVVSFINTTTYTLYVTDKNNCTATAQTTVTINHPFTVDAGATELKITTGETVELYAYAPQATSYTWTANIGGMNGTGNRSNVFVGPTTTTKYFVTATDSAGCVGTDNVTIKVNPLPVGVSASNDTTITKKNLNFSQRDNFYSFDVKNNVSVSQGSFFNDYAAGLHLTNDYSMQQFHQFTDEEGHTHTRYQQYYKNVPVFNGQYVLESNSSNVLYGLGRLGSKLNLNVNPAVDANSALQTALSSIGGQPAYPWLQNPNYPMPEGKLMIVPIDAALQGSVYTLAWKFDIPVNIPFANYMVLIDANTGTLINMRNVTLADMPNPVPYTRPVNTLYNGTQNTPIIKYQACGFGNLNYGYLLGQYGYLGQLNNSKPSITPNDLFINIHGRTNPSDFNTWYFADLSTQGCNTTGTVDNAIYYNGNYTSLGANSNFTGTPLPTPPSGNPFPGIMAGSALWGMQQINYFFFTKYGWLGFDKMGTKQLNCELNYVGGATHYWNSVISISLNTGNASDGSVFYLAGNTPTPLPSISVDMIGHEYAHGIQLEFVNYTPNGDVFEPLADIMGMSISNWVKKASGGNPYSDSSISSTNWGIGFLQSITPKRNGANPTSVKSWWAPNAPHPDTYMEKPNYNATGNPSYDQYSNGEILNHWYWLLIYGSATYPSRGSGPEKVNGVGWTYTVSPINNVNPTDYETGAAIANNIVFQTMTKKLLDGLSFSDFRIATLQITKSLYGDYDANGNMLPIYKTVSAAWHAVGVDSSFGEYNPKMVTQNNLQSFYNGTVNGLEVLQTQIAKDDKSPFEYQLNSTGSLDGGTTQLHAPFITRSYSLTAGGNFDANSPDTLKTYFPQFNIFSTSYLKNYPANNQELDTSYSAVQVHFATQMALTYFANTWDWLGLDKAGTYTIQNYVGAQGVLPTSPAADISQIFYPLGNSLTPPNLVFPKTSIDYVAKNIAQRIYDNQVGQPPASNLESIAIAEAFGDIFGLASKNFYRGSLTPTLPPVWTIGEDVNQKKSGNPLAPPDKDISTPYFSGLPGYYQDYNWNYNASDPTAPSKDATVIDYCYYLLKNGGPVIITPAIDPLNTINGNITYNITPLVTVGIGVSQAQPLTYVSQADALFYNMLTGNSSLPSKNSTPPSAPNFLDMRNASLSLMESKFGSPIGSTGYESVRQAWCAVGVYDKLKGYNLECQQKNEDPEKIYITAPSLFLATVGALVVATAVTGGADAEVTVPLMATAINAEVSGVTVASAVAGATEALSEQAVASTGFRIALQTQYRIALIAEGVDAAAAANEAIVIDEAIQAGQAGSRLAYATRGVLLTLPALSATGCANNQNQPEPVIALQALATPSLNLPAISTKFDDQISCGMDCYPFDEMFTGDNSAVNSQTLVQTHAAMQFAIDYFAMNHAWNSVDKAGTIPINCIVGNNSPTLLNEGDFYFHFGDPATYSLSVTSQTSDNMPQVSTDLVGKQLAERIFDYNFVIPVTGEALAIRSSCGDIFGRNAKNKYDYYISKNPATWKIGEEIFSLAGNGGYLRDMRYPKTSPAKAQADCYGGNNYDAANQNAYVNSGVMNRWYYLLSNGSSSSNNNQETNDFGYSYTITGIGDKVASQILFEVIVNYQNYLPWAGDNNGNSFTFKDMANATLKAAKALGFPAETPAYETILAAWLAVNVHPDGAFNPHNISYGPEVLSSTILGKNYSVLSYYNGAVSVPATETNILSDLNSPKEYSLLHNPSQQDDQNTPTDKYPVTFATEYIPSVPTATIMPFKDYAIADGIFGITNTLDSSKIAVSVQWGIGQAINYFAQTPFNWIGLDGAGTLPVTANIGLVNNFPTQPQPLTGELYYNYADPTNGNKPQVSLDLVSKIYTQGIWDAAIGNTNGNEPAAIREFYGDIFGVSVYNSVRAKMSPAQPALWTIGDDMYSPQQPGGIGSNNVKSLEYPKLKLFPDCYQSDTWNTAVAISPANPAALAGVLDRFYYLLVNGNENNGATLTNDVGTSYLVNGIGSGLANTILFNILSNTLSANSTFDDFQNAVLQETVKEGYAVNTPVYNSAMNALIAVNLYGTFQKNIATQGESYYNGLVNFIAVETKASDNLGGVLQNSLQTLVNSDSPYPQMNTYYWGSQAPVADFAPVDGIYTAQNEPNYGAISAACVSIQYGTQTFLDYCKNTLGWDGIDEAGTLPINSYLDQSGNNPSTVKAIHYNYAGGPLNSPQVSLDIVGSKLTNAIFDNLNPNVGGDGSSIRESFGHIFGRASENYALGVSTWKFGADAWLTDYNMGAPKNDPFIKPDCYGGQHYDISSSPNADVNSSVLDFCFYLLENGGTGYQDDQTGLGYYTVTAMDHAMIEKIFFQAMVSLPSAPSYTDMPTALTNAATTLGQSESVTQNILTACWAVGLCPSPGTIYSSPDMDADVNPWAVTIARQIVYPDFESGWQMEISSDPSFTGDEVYTVNSFNGTLTSTVVAIDNNTSVQAISVAAALKPSTNYYWHVKTTWFNKNMTVIPCTFVTQLQTSLQKWSSTMKFSTKDRTPVLVAGPSEAAQKADITAYYPWGGDMQWQPVQVSDPATVKIKYHVQLGMKDQVTSDPFIDQVFLPTTNSSTENEGTFVSNQAHSSQTNINLQPDSNYSWLVYAEGPSSVFQDNGQNNGETYPYAILENGISENVGLNSEAESFKTIIPTTNGIVPIDGEAISGFGTNFQDKYEVPCTWKNTPNAAGYELKIARDKEITDVTIDDNNIIGTYKGVPYPMQQTDKNNTYYWTVTPLAPLLTNDASTAINGKTSDAISFTMDYGVDSLITPDTLIPFNNNNQPLVFSWTDAPGATEYSFWIGSKGCPNADAASVIFSTTVLENTVTTHQSYTIDPAINPVLFQSLTHDYPNGYTWGVTPKLITASNVEVDGYLTTQDYDFMPSPVHFKLSNPPTTNNENNPNVISSISMRCDYAPEGYELRIGTSVVANPTYGLILPGTNSSVGNVATGNNYSIPPFTTYGILSNFFQVLYFPDQLVTDFFGLYNGTNGKTLVLDPGITYYIEIISHGANGLIYTSPYQTFTTAAPTLGITQDVASACIQDSKITFNWTMNAAPATISNPNPFTCTIVYGLNGGPSQPYQVPQANLDEFNGTTTGTYQENVASLGVGNWTWTINATYTDAANQVVTASSTSNFEIGSCPPPPHTAPCNLKPDNDVEFSTPHDITLTWDDCDVNYGPADAYFVSVLNVTNGQQATIVGNIVNAPTGTNNSFTLSQNYLHIGETLEFGVKAHYNPSVQFPQGADVISDTQPFNIVKDAPAGPDGVENCAGSTCSTQLYMFWDLEGQIDFGLLAKSSCFDDWFHWNSSAGPPVTSIIAMGGNQDILTVFDQFMEENTTAEMSVIINSVPDPNTYTINWSTPPKIWLQDANGVIIYTHTLLPSELQVGAKFILFYMDCK